MGVTKVNIWDLVGAYPVCTACGSRKVIREAWAAWSMHTREWGLQNIFDDFCCDSCGLPGLPEWKLDEAFRKKRICRLNDAVRHGEEDNATVVVTTSLRAKGVEFIKIARNAVAAFDTFTEDNDPHGEHDFGAFDVGGEKLFWKIDCFDRALKMHSPDAANPSVTHRVLTLMLAHEY